MTELWDVPRTHLPTRRGTVTVWAQHEGGRDQPTYLVQRDGEQPETLLDANALSDDGTVAVNVTSLSPDGGLFTYAVSDGGSDWQVIRIRDTATGEDLADELRHVKFTSIAWHEDGFFYSRFPEADPTSVGIANDPWIAYHHLGTPQDDDRVVFHNADDPDPGYDPQVSHDGRYLILTEWLGTSRQNGLLVLDLADPQAEWRRLRSHHEAAYWFLAHVDGRMVVQTDLDAPNGRIAAIDLASPDGLDEIVPESEHAIEFASAAGGELLLVLLVDAAHRVERHAVDGSPLGPLDLPGVGTVLDLSGKVDDDVAFLAYQSFTEPPGAFAITHGEAERFGPPPPATIDVEITRRSCVSSDGAEVGMFVLRATGTALPAPTDLYGYGGFSITMTPVFNPARLAFLEQGGVVVVANLRGGKEHGERWHEQGMLGSKQQVFDDFIACAEDLIDAGVTTRRQLSISGRSNGGLLTMAVMLQRPELFGAVVSHVPVTDMLRYQHFTAGRYWTVEFGDAADEEAFRWLIEYSPLHNVDPDAAYPPTLITTGEGDDRVVPMHALKMAAELQHAAGGSSEHPLLVRIDTRAGHGMGKPTSKLIDEWADSYAFVLFHCGAVDEHE